MIGFSAFMRLRLKIKLIFVESVKIFFSIHKMPIFLHVKLKEINFLCTVWIRKLRYSIPSHFIPYNSAGEVFELPCSKTIGWGRTTRGWFLLVKKKKRATVLKYHHKTRMENVWLRSETETSIKGGGERENVIQVISSTGKKRLNGRGDDQKSIWISFCFGMNTFLKDNFSHFLNGWISNMKVLFAKWMEKRSYF